MDNIYHTYHGMKTVNFCRCIADIDGFLELGITKNCASLVVVTYRCEVLRSFRLIWV
jgi:hypothetical protein